ncbi:hypothetical protein B484DRAFT_44664, partial [Ochromonadaceae sp. CCMP2298]
MGLIIVILVIVIVLLSVYAIVYKCTVICRQSSALSQNPAHSYEYSPPILRAPRAPEPSEGAGQHDRVLQLAPQPQQHLVVAALLQAVQAPPQGQGDAHRGPRLPRPLQSLPHPRLLAHQQQKGQSGGGEAVACLVADQKVGVALRQCETDERQYLWYALSERLPALSALVHVVLLHTVALEPHRLVLVQPARMQRHLLRPQEQHCRYVRIRTPPHPQRLRVPDPDVASGPAVVVSHLPRCAVPDPLQVRPHLHSARVHRHLLGGAASVVFDVDGAAEGQQGVHLSIYSRG